MGTPEWGRRERITDPYGRAGSDGAKHFLAEPLGPLVKVLGDAMTTRDLLSVEAKGIWDLANFGLGRRPEFLGGVSVPETKVVLPGGKDKKLVVSWLLLMQKVIGDDYHRSPGDWPNPLGAIRDDAGIIDRIQSWPSDGASLALMDMRVGRCTVRIQGPTENNFIALAVATLASQSFYSFLSEKQPIHAELMLLEESGFPVMRFLLIRQFSPKAAQSDRTTTYKLEPSNMLSTAPAVFMICLGSPYRFNG